MRAVVIAEFGGPENLIVKNIPDPEPRPNHIIIKIKAFGLNRAELYFRSGLWGDVPRVTGIECVGVVHSDPEGNFNKGETVMALMGGMGRTINGSYAEMVCVPLSNVVAVNTNLPWEELAAIPESYATAWACLTRNLELSSGQTVLIRGATSALGQAAANIASIHGANVIGTTRDKARFETLRALGAEPMLDIPNLSEQIRSRHKNGIDAVVDIVGNSTVVDSLAMVRPCGRVCLAGFLGGGAPVDAFDPLTQMPSGVQFSFFASAFTFGTTEFPLSAIPFQSFVDRAADGKYRAKPAHVFDLSNIVEAHRMMESNTANGKLVVTV